MAIFKEISSNDIKTQRSFLNSLIDVLQMDISGSSTRRKYQSFVTGGVGPGVTSSLFQTVYDQDFSLQTANAIFDITMGLFHTGSVVNNSKVGQDAAGKLLFPSSTLMMREKTDIYKQFAQNLLGDANGQFVAPVDSTNITDQIDAGLFICFKRLFSRDRVKRETFAMRTFSSGAYSAGVQHLGAHLDVPVSSSQINTYAKIWTDIGSSNNKNVTFGGEVGNIVDAVNTNSVVGLFFYDRGIAVLDMNKIFQGDQLVSGTVHAMNAIGGFGFSPGQTPIGSAVSENPNAKFIPDFMVSGSIDNIIDHVCNVRFGKESNTAITFQNITNINSTLVFCRAAADEFNYSSNPTYTTSDNRIVVIDPGQEDTQSSFTFITSVGLYDANDNLLAIAKVSRPLEKDSSRDLTLRCRMDYAKKKSISLTKK